MHSSKKTKKKSNLAAIDIGTNSFHLIVAEVQSPSGRFKILDRDKENVRLGSGSTDMKHLSDAAMNRGVETLGRFKRIADSMKAPVRAIATSAVREALNQEEFVRRVKAETGIAVEIASGVEEARLIHLGVLQALPIYARRLLLVDIGGGSTEILVGRRRSISYSNSIKLGAVRLTQRFFRSSRLERSEVRECRKYIRGMLAPIVRSTSQFAIDVVVGSSGTISTLANIIRLRRGDTGSAPLNGTSFTIRELSEVVEDILNAREPEERLQIDGLDPARADIIVAGALILEQIFRELEIASMIVSEFALREGILLDTIEQRRTVGRVRHLSDIRRTSVQQVADQYQSESGHARHVTRLALSLFDQTKSLHRMGERERGYLEAAALLHEVGLYVSHSQHHRHSYYLIRNADILGFTENEKEIIANVARYHRKSHPKEKHEGYRLLNENDREIVARLSSILRIADGLDRTHETAVRDVRVRRAGRGMRVFLEGRQRRGLDLEIWGADQKKSLFEETFNVHVTISEEVVRRGRTSRRR